MLDESSHAGVERVSVARVGGWAGSVRHLLAGLGRGPGDLKHVVAVVLPVARALPELRVEELRSRDLVEPSLHVGLFQEVDEPVPDPGPMRQKDGVARGIGVEKPQLLLGADAAVVSLRSLLLELGPFLEVKRGRLQRGWDLELAA